MTQNWNETYLIEPTIDRMADTLEQLKNHIDKLNQVKRNLQTFNLAFGNVIHRIQNVATSIQFPKVSKYLSLRSQQITLASCRQFTDILSPLGDES
jgi:hypothetical protein